ncbi:hypothetical protein [Cellvibrio sp. QJXJ]|uniref:hypothetical protein n=1 Tax=Cellvibrio sp. QJXJ TaxID=2964606 RepID=UPI0021C35E16|nr:hypothetical protein [Cellvibrio sp. QJXJ]UUA72424.1 hypothetical protein NNX04_18715 [Cellvibrio sp. QJXJ]
MKLDNPAARLLTILEQGIELQNEMGCRKAWCQLLNVPKGENAMLMGRIGKVMSLSTDIIENLKNIGDVKIDRYLHWVEPLETAFINSNLNSPWSTFKSHINVHVINYLSMTSDLLSHKNAESIISEPSLDSILLNTRALIDEVRDSNLPDHIKKFMIKQLHEICLAVEEHSICGSESVSRAVNAAFGYGVLHADSVELAKSDPIAKKFWQQMANVALIVSISTGIQQLAPPIMKLLPEINFEESCIENNSQVQPEHTQRRASTENASNAETSA